MNVMTTYNTTQQIFELALARMVATPDLQHGRLVHLSWRAPEQGGRLVQFYLNGELSGSCLSAGQREAWMVIDPDRHVEIELLAVDPSVVGVDFAGELAGAGVGTQPTASIAVLRDLSLPAETSLSVVVDGREPERIGLFLPSDIRGGFGAVFGEGGFGYDASLGLGLGQGELGYGGLGSGGVALRWRDDTLSPGAHTVALSLEDDAGRVSGQSTSVQVTVDRLPSAPLHVELDDDFHLTWS